MKRILSAVMAIVMLCVMACVGTSAEPMMLMEDTFSGELNPHNWCTLPGANAFYTEDGWCVGDHSAAYLQSEYGPDEGSGITPKAWSYCSISVDVRFDDFSIEINDGGYFAALWWKDYQIQEGADYYPGDEIETGSIYELRLYPVHRRIDLYVGWSEILPETTTLEGSTAEEVETETVLASYTLPDDYELEVDYNNPTIVNLGLRCEPNRIRGYLDGKLVIDYAAPTVIGDKRESPILFHNAGLMIGLDNFRVATVDYPLFAADLEPQPTEPTPTNTVAPTESLEPETSIITETEVVSSVNDKGEVVTSVVVNSEVVTVPPVANTNPTPSVGGTSTATGDMAFIVVAVMIVALGTAIVVKKVNVE